MKYRKYEKLILSLKEISHKKLCTHPNPICPKRAQTVPKKCPTCAQKVPNMCPKSAQKVNIVV
jgi:hypothetical protein